MEKMDNNVTSNSKNDMKKKWGRKRGKHENEEEEER